MFHFSDGTLQLLHALDGIDEAHCTASLRQLGFLVPAVQYMLQQLHDGLNMSLLKACDYQQINMSHIMR